MNMHKFVKSVLLVGILCFGLAAAGSAATLKVGSVSGSPGSTVPMTIDVVYTGTEATGVAGAAFTIEYDTTILDIAVDSTYFGTFANQWTLPSTLPSPTPATTVTVGTDTYDQPLVTNVITAGTPTGQKIAAARVVPGNPSGTVTLFTLDVTINPNATITDPPTKYPIKIVPSVIDNASAGYTTPTVIDLLIGAKDTTVALNEAFPPLVYAANFNDASGGGVTVTNMVDNDGDGIDDNWETQYVGDTAGANASTDYDVDGYLDIVEYNQSTDPTVKNNPSGTGYNAETDARVYNVDIDGDGEFKLNDVTLFRRWNAGWLDDRLISGRGIITAGVSQRDTIAEIVDYCNVLDNYIFDIDGDGEFKLNDVTLFRRWDAGWLDDRLISGRGIISTSSRRNTVQMIVDYLNGLKLEVGK